MKNIRLAFLMGILISFAEMEASPIIGSSANTLPKGTVMVENHIIYFTFTKSYNPETEEWSPLPEGQWFRITTMLPQVYYGILDWLCARATIPLSLKESHFDESTSSIGLSDMVIDCKIRLMKGDKYIPRTSSFVGIRLPTGNTDASPALGDGSIDFVIGGLLTKKLSPFVIHTMLGHWRNGTDKNEEDIKDETFYNLAIESPKFKDFVAVGELDGKFVGSYNDKNLLHLCPGIQYKGIKGLTLETSFKIPVIAKSDKEGDLLYPFYAFIGLMYIF